MKKGLEYCSSSKCYNILLILFILSLCFIFISEQTINSATKIIRNIVTSVDSETVENNTAKKYITTTTTTTTTKLPRTSTSTTDVPKSTSKKRDSSISHEALKYFNTSISDHERSIFLNLLEAFMQVVPKNMTYLMYGGTLLGSYRHHGMIPWDDDLDLLVRENDKETLFRTLKTLEPEFRLAVQVDNLWKFYHNSSTPTRKRWGAWPFIDIFFYRENASHIWDSHYAISQHKYAKKDVFPLISRPFMGKMLPAPKNTVLCLKAFFDTQMCVSISWSHKRQEQVELQAKIPCNKLRSRFPFVRRKYYRNKTVEILEDPLHPNRNNSVFVVNL